MTSEIPILLVGPVAAPGGAERALAGLVRHLGDHGFKPHVALLQRGPAETWMLEAGAQLTVVEAGRGRTLQAARFLPVVAKLRRLVKANGCRLVVSNLAKGHVYGGVVAVAARVPAVYWQQGIPRRRLLDALAARSPATSVICSCEEARVAQLAQTPRALVRKVPLGIDLQAVKEYVGTGAALRQNNGWDDRIVVGMVGRLEPWKGQRTFLRAASLVAKRNEDALFVVVGGAVVGYEGDYPLELQRLAEDLGIADRVVFTGHQDPVYPWYEALDVVVHASEEPEPFGLVVIEAMALGSAVVATAGGGPLETVKEGESGLLVPIGDPASMADAIVRLIEEPDLRKSLETGARARAEQFSDSTMAAGIAQVLTEALEAFEGRSSKGMRRRRQSD